jgi:hypothetical protein
VVRPHAEPRTPADLDALVVALPQPDPERRPVPARWWHGRGRVAAGARGPVRARSARGGRPSSADAELAELESRCAPPRRCARRDQRRIGIGERAAEELPRAARAQPCSARAVTREAILFKARTAWDETRRVLAAPDTVAACCPTIAATADLLPVLGRVPRIAAASDPRALTSTRCTTAAAPSPPRAPTRPPAPSTRWCCGSTICSGRPRQRRAAA